MGQLIYNLFLLLCISFFVAIVRFWWIFNKWFVIVTFIIFAILIVWGVQ